MSGVLGFRGLGLQIGSTTFMLSSLRTWGFRVSSGKRFGRYLSIYLSIYIYIYIDIDVDCVALIRAVTDEYTLVLATPHCCHYGVRR